MIRRLFESRQSPLRLAGRDAVDREIAHRLLSGGLRASCQLRQPMSRTPCLDCGQPLQANAPGGLCPACLLRLAEPSVTPRAGVSEETLVAAADPTAPNPE